MQVQDKSLTVPSTTDASFGFDAPEPKPEAAGGESGFLWTEVPVAPWRRYGARVLDMVTNGTAGWIMVCLIWFQLWPISADSFLSYLDGPFGRLLDLTATVAVGCLVSALVLGATGSTLGKVIFGIRVRNVDGSPLGFADSLRRELLVWIRGLGFGVPIISLVTLALSYGSLKDKGQSVWDIGKHQVVYRRGGSQMALNILGIALIIAARAGLAALEKL